MQNIKLGLDCPTSWLEIVQPLADYDYILVEKASKDKKYLRYFRNSPRPKILNNRVMMKGEPVSLELIESVRDEVGGGEVIAPDWMWNSKQTFDAYEECCDTFGEENVIGVIQGITPEDIDTCLSLYGNKIAIPFDVGSFKQDAIELKVRRRIELVGKLSAKKIHLLGLTTVKELEFYSSDTCESLNTGLPVLLAYQGIYIEDFYEDKMHSSYHFMDMDNPPIDDRTEELIKDNVSFIKRLL